MSADKLIYLICAEASERESLAKYFKKHQFNCQVFDGLASGQEGVVAKSPDLIVLAGSSLPSPDICKFGAFVEKHSDSPIIALLTQLQMSIVSEMAESENLWTAEYPISLREIRASVTEALEELEAGE
jgi:DNA-binding NtrC family response regulator